MFENIATRLLNQDLTGLERLAEKTSVCKLTCYTCGQQEDEDNMTQVDNESICIGCTDTNYEERGEVTE